VTLVLITEYEAAPGREDRLRTALEAMIEPSLDHPGCLAYRCYADPNAPGRMLTLEEWRDGDCRDAVTGAPYHRHFAQVLCLVLAAPPTVRALLD
jgi:quinol monooxygenase YgiN